jgi:hypothetical protein
MTNSWYGKFHLEMRWHHQFHFLLWGRPAFAQRSDGYFDAVREPAREFTRERQGYTGVCVMKRARFSFRCARPEPVLAKQTCSRWQEKRVHLYGGRHHHHHRHHHRCCCFFSQVFAGRRWSDPRRK